MFSKVLTPNLKIILFLNVILFIALFISFPAFAVADATADTAITEGLCRVVGLLSGNVAKIIATVAIFFIAISMFFGKINWGTALVTAIAIVVLFSAPKIVSFISGEAGDACAATTQ